MAVGPATDHLSSLREQLEKSVQAFVEGEVLPRVAKMERTPDKVDDDLPRLIARQGWTSCTYGPGYGGLGVGHTGKTLVLELLSRASGAAGAIAQAPIIPAEAVLRLGNEDQRRQWLPAFASGDHLPAIDVTEPDAGADILAMESTGTRVGDRYLINGHKSHVGGAHPATVHLVVVRTGPDRTGGLSAFLVESDRKGLEVLPHSPMIGLRGFSCADVRFDNCWVPAANRIGAEGDGLLVAHVASIIAGRPNLAAVALGIHQGIWEAVDRQIIGHRRLRKVQVVQQRVGKIRGSLLISRAALYEAVRHLDHDVPCVEELIASKFGAVDAVEESAREAIKAVGADGLYVGDLPYERFLRDAHCLWFPAGTGDVQLYRLSQLVHETRPPISEAFRPPATAAAGPTVNSVPEPQGVPLARRPWP